MSLLMILAREIKVASPGVGHYFTLIAFVIATLLGSCMSAPMKSSKPWWFHPCNSSIPKIRHSRSTTNEGFLEVKRQLGNFVLQLKDSKRKLETWYKESTTPKANFTWLKMKKSLTLITKSKKPSKKMENLFNAAQYFAGTLEVLRNVRIKTEVIPDFDQSERDRIYKNITYHIRSLLCELYEYLEKNGVKPKGISLKKMQIPQFDQPLDFTDGHMWDINFFSKTKKFFKQIQKKLKKRNSHKKSVSHKKRT